MEIEAIDCLFNRDNNGKLVPIVDKIKVGTKLINDKKEDIELRIKYLPVTRGQYYKLLQLKEKGNMTEKDIDKNLMFECLIEPKFNEQQINDMKPIIFDAIVTRIMSTSFSVNDVQYENTTVEELDEVKKKS